MPKAAIYSSASVRTCFLTLSASNYELQRAVASIAAILSMISRTLRSIRRRSLLTPPPTPDATVSLLQATRLPSTAGILILTAAQ